MTRWTFTDIAVGVALSFLVSTGWVIIVTNAIRTSPCEITTLTDQELDRIRWEIEAEWNRRANMGTAP